MPEISEAEYRQLMRYQSLGTVEDLEKLPRKVEALEDDNKKQRDEIRGLKEKLPAEDAVVLTGDEAKLWPKLREFGDPADIESKLSEGEQARAKLAEVSWRESARAAAKAAGWNEDAFLALPGVKAYGFELRKEKDGDAEVLRAYAVPLEGEDKREKRLDESLLGEREDWRALRPALEAKPAGSEPEPAPAPAAWPKQKEAERGAGGYDPVAAGKAMAAAQKKSTDNSLAFR